MFNFMKKKEAAPAKKGAGKKVVAKVNEFAYGLVGSDIESPNFDPLQLSAGRSEETVNWYRAAELKVIPMKDLCTKFVPFNDSKD